MNRQARPYGRIMRIRRWRRPLSPRRLPVMLESVRAGFPSVAQDYASDDLSLDEHLIDHPDTTFLVRVAGDSMIGAGIFDNDLLIVDRSLEPVDGDVVVAVLDGELTVKRLAHDRHGAYLHAENPKYPDIRPASMGENLIWGVVTGSFHAQRGRRGL